jgi:DNA polymerase epsilon subunit 1
MLCYFVDENGTTFKATYKYSPYFYVAFIEGYEREVRMYIENKVPKYEEAVEVEKEDLEDPRHLSGVPRKYIKISFKTVNDLMAGRQPLKHMLETRKSK